MPSWKLASSDNALALDLNANDDGAISGSVTHDGREYPVTGAWAASGSIPGRNASAFALSGRTQTTPDVPNFLAAAGIMTGPGNNPTRIDIRASVSSSSDGSLSYYSGALIPSPSIAPRREVARRRCISPTPPTGTRSFAWSAPISHIFRNPASGSRLPERKSAHGPSRITHRPDGP